MVSLTKHGRMHGHIILVQVIKLNKDNRFELYAIGAPQRHGHNLYKQNLGAYDADFAASVDGYDTEALGEDGKIQGCRKVL